jgi:hypothetical protein
MDMGTAAGPFEHAGYQDFIVFQDSAADRADPGPIAVEAVDAASYVHEPVLAAVKRREGRRFDQFSFVQFC